MFVRRLLGSRPIAIALLAASLLAAGGPATAPRALAADGPLSWSPSRDEAVVVDELPARLIAEEIPSDSLINRSRMMRRPAGLSRPAPASLMHSAPAGSRSYGTSAPLAGETFITSDGQPISPDGLPVPSELYYDENGGLPAANCPPNCTSGCCQPGCVEGCGQWRFGAICLPVARPPLNNFEIFGGVQGFTGPANRGASGSFGFHEGFNWGVPITQCLAGQLGARWTQSSFDGSFLTGENRNQIFATAGLFRRTDWGFQGGLVFDYFHDEWDYQADLGQLRGELSWLDGCRNELGFWFTAGVNDSQFFTVQTPVVASATSIRLDTIDAALEVNDIYAFFYRRHFVSGGDGRIFGGFTSNSQGLVGADFDLPINPRWSLQAGFLYAVPGDPNPSTGPGFAQESWNVGLSLVWTPCARDACGPNYCRPLFRVADNGSFLTRLIGR